jgi:hypothetical protein
MLAATARRRATEGHEWGRLWSAAHRKKWVRWIR